MTCPGFTHPIVRLHLCQRLNIQYIYHHVEKKRKYLHIYLCLLAMFAWDLFGMLLLQFSFLRQYTEVHWKRGNIFICNCFLCMCRNKLMQHLSQIIQAAALQLQGGQRKRQTGRQKQREGESERELDLKHFILQGL